MTPPYCLLVSSCDAYADCWMPFFVLLTTYWQSFDHPIYLNTETRAVDFPNLEIICPRVALDSRRPLAWSDRLMKCLDVIPHEYVLYAQEDYFINDTVDVAMIDECVTLMERDHISHISFNRGRRPGTKSQYQFLDRIKQRADYRINMQAGLWRRSTLRSYLRRHETVWELEWYGSRRAWRRSDSFFQVNPEYDEARGNRVIPYRATGVVHGRWVRAVVEELFAAHGIEVDFSQRGFLDRDNDTWGQRRLMTKVIRRLRSIP